MKIYILLITLLITVTVSSGKADEGLTDEELLNICLKNAGRRIANDLHEKGYSEICVVESPSETDERINFILIESIANEIKNMNGSIFLMKEKGTRGKPTLFYRVIEKNVSIEEKDRFWGAPVVERDIRVKISYRLVAPETGEILISKEIEESLKNKISQKAYTNLTKGAKKGVSFTSLLEPAIVTAIVGGLMYLFYSQKSSK
ncbi:MAG: hypothetical protein E3J87_02325 [Candidatus Cloacimonadota bacterium]|nr:MAG: hypothetical protein E3J87_02325 [Candidatus Cloacimonadota bacterium]